MAATTLLRERQTRDGIRTFSSEALAGTHTFGGSDSRTTVCTTTTFVHHELHYFGRSGLRSWREKGASVGTRVRSMVLSPLFLSGDRRRSAYTHLQRQSLAQQNSSNPPGGGQAAQEKLHSKWR